MASLTKLKSLVVMSAAVATTTAGRSLLRWRTAASASGASAFVSAGAGADTASIAQRHLRAAGPTDGRQSGATLAASQAQASLAATICAPLLAGAALGAVGRALAARRRPPLQQRVARVATKAEGDAEAGSEAEVPTGPPSDISAIDFRVGQIVSCQQHPDSDKLLVEMIDVGEGEPRQICSGISAYYAPEAIVGKRVVIVANLKERKIGGTPSNGMVLCASKGDAEERQLALVEPPAGAALGERVVIELEGQVHGEPEAPNKVEKKKLYLKVCGDFKTNAEGVVCYKTSPFNTTAGPCTAKSILDGIVS